MRTGLKLAEGMGGWLLFEHHSFRADLFSEKYLAHGIGSILNGTPDNKTIAEYDHPVLSPKKNWAGRNPQIDFVQENKNGVPIIAIESKFFGIGNSKISVGDIIWDLVRLELTSHALNTTCYFILAGKKKKIHSLFAQKKFLDPKKHGDPRPILPTLDHRKRKMQVRFCSDQRLKTFARYFRLYKDVSMPSVIGCTSIDYYPKECRNFDNQVFVWEIKSLKNEPRFRPKDDPRFH
jgi:hypothetical protein